MSGIAALLAVDGARADAGIGSAMLSRLAHRGPDGRGDHADGIAWVGQQQFVVTNEEALDTPPLRSRDGQRWIVADARIDNRDELEAALGLHEASDTGLILAAYERWGDACPEHLIGDFAFVVWDAGRRRLFAARDHMGIRALFYHRDARLFRCASEAHALFADRAVPRRPNRHSMALFLAEQYLERDETLYEGIFAVPPAHRLSLGESGSLRIEAYWRPDPTRRVRYASGGEYADHFRVVLGDAVRCRMRARGPIASQLSGGLDSSSVVTLAEQARRASAPASDPLLLVHTSFPGLACDEDEFSRAVAERWGLPLVVCAPPEADAFRPDVTRLETDVIYHPLSLLWKQQLDMLRSRGVRVLLTGLGSDQIMARTGLEGADALREGDLVAAARAAGSPLLSPRTWRSLLFQTLRPIAPERLVQTWRNVRRAKQPYLPRFVTTATAREILADRVDSDRRRRASAGFPATRELIHALTRGYEVLFDNASLAPIAAHGGVELRSPFYDVRLVEMLLSFPHEQRCGVDRHETKPLLRRAIDLPPLVRDRRRGAEFSSHLHRVLVEQHADTIRRLFHGGVLEGLGLVDGPAARQILDDVRKDWSLLRDVANLVGLELWARHCVE